MADDGVIGGGPRGDEGGGGGEGGGEGGGGGEGPLEGVANAQGQLARDVWGRGLLILPTSSERELRVGKVPQRSGSLQVSVVLCGGGGG